MPVARPLEPITDDDAAIREALEHAEVPALLPAIAYATGDLSILRDDLRPNSALILDPNAGLSPEQQAEARRLAFDALIGLRDGTIDPGGHPDDSALAAMIEYMVGNSVEEYLPLFRQELGVEGEDLRAPDWSKGDLAPDRPFTVAVIGAGMSGLAAAYRMKQAGIDYVVLEKNDDVGGTWLENTYPGCRVDVSNHFYSYSFMQNNDWPQHFSTQEVLLDYFRRCAEEFGLRDHIRFNTEVERAEWDDDRNLWVLTVRTATGASESVEANAVISAVGQLNRPNLPAIDGRDEFAGPSFHSARWDHDVEFAGKRVAVIGTGASAAQFIPIVAEQASELIVFQRTPNWLISTPDYHEEVADEVRWLFRHVLTYASWYRLWLFWRNAEGMLPLVRVDPEWDNGGKSVSAQNEFMRSVLAAYLEAEFADTPELLPDVMPHYPPAAKRVIRDNGIWARTLKRDNVTLVTDRIERITSSGIRTADAGDHEVDVIVYATGFTASKFLTPMEVKGRKGVDLHEQWDGNARAYLGITVPQFPNLFLLYGPNTNIVINGSITYFSECEVHYVVECIRLLLERDAAALDVKPVVHDAYNEEIDAENLQMAWGASDVNSWYKNAVGRVAQNWPYSLLEYWQRTREPNPDDYELLH